MGAHEPERPERDLERTKQDRESADERRGVGEDDQGGREGRSKAGLEQREEDGRQAGQS